MKITKALLEQELHRERQAKWELQGNINKLYDKQKLAGLYLQTLYVMSSYINETFTLGTRDYKRLAKLLDFNEFPEGF